MRILITGGAGFIGSALIRHIVRYTPHRVLNVDKLIDAGDLTTVAKNARDLDRRSMGDYDRSGKFEQNDRLAERASV